MRDGELSHLFGLVKPTRESCLACHGGETPSLQPFDVEQAMKQIDHWSADQAARSKPGASRDRSPHTRLAAWLRVDAAQAAGKGRP